MSVSMTPMRQHESHHAMARWRAPDRRQSGLGLVEMMIVMVIAILMLFGLFSIQYGTRQNYLAQNQLTQLEDGERLAVTDLASVVQEAGYFPDPTVESESTALPVASLLNVSGQPFSAGQGVFGLSGQTNGVETDVLYVRYKTAPTDGVMDCTGATNASGANEIVVNEFSVLNNQLVCTVSDNGTVTTYPLVSNVTGMKVEYGVDTNNDGSADEYLQASQITGAPNSATVNWNNVVSAQVVLTFATPFTGVAAVGAQGVTAPVITLTRTIALLNRSESVSSGSGGTTTGGTTTGGTTTGGTTTGGTTTGGTTTGGTTTGGGDTSGGTSGGTDGGSSGGSSGGGDQNQNQNNQNQDNNNPGSGGDSHHSRNQGGN